ncbi:MAG: hypothetical protein ISR48_12275 [Alphaproteobacteria bacterium]|nr:hypothetical protein [Alphaproteobacteria bacterium]
MKWFRGWFAGLLAKTSDEWYYDICPKCGGTLEVEKDTMTGTEWRTYLCSACGWEKDVKVGKALWKALSDARKEEKA